MTEIKPCAHCGEKMTADVLCKECAGRTYSAREAAEKAIELIRDAEQEIPEPTRHEMYRFARLEPVSMLYYGALIHCGEAKTLDEAIREAEQVQLAVKANSR
jgi:predicted RNase H-like HicB family nuclease